MAEKTHQVMRWPDAGEVSGKIFQMWLPTDLRRRLESSLQYLNNSQPDGSRSLNLRDIILTAVFQWIEQDENARGTSARHLIGWSPTEAKRQ